MTTKFKVLVCGGRDYHNYEKVREVLNFIKNICEENVISKSEIVIIHGGAKGADSLAGRWAAENKITSEVYIADWTTYGKSAGPIRNELMLKTGTPDIVVAFPGGQGTNHMIKISKKKNVEVYEIDT